MPKRKTHVIDGFGQRLAQLRKSAGYTQVEFAAEVGITQRMVAYYEAPHAQPPANLLPLIARALGVSIDALLGVEPSRHRAKSADTRLQRRLAQIEKLSAPEGRQILQMLDALIERGQLRQKVRSGTA